MNVGAMSRAMIEVTCYDRRGSTSTFWPTIVFLLFIRGQDSSTNIIVYNNIRDRVKLSFYLKIFVG